MSLNYPNNDKSAIVKRKTIKKSLLMNKKLKIA